MVPHADILDQQESLKKPFLASILFHAGVIVVFGGWHLYSNANKVTLGTATPGFGNSVSVDAVRAIPIPSRRGRINPVANDTESQLQQHVEEKTQPRQKTPPPEKDAVNLKSRMPDKPVNKNYAIQKYRAQPLQPNQITSSQAPAAVSPMFQKAGTNFGVGINPNSIVGTMFGGYAQALMEAVARHWNTGGLMGVQVPMAIINVNILRNGTIRNPQIAQRSGNTTLDYSALRAVTEAAPFPPLPPEFNGSYMNIDFRFQLQR